MGCFPCWTTKREQAMLTSHPWVWNHYTCATWMIDIPVNCHHPSAPYITCVQEKHPFVAFVPTLLPSYVFILSQEKQCILQAYGAHLGLYMAAAYGLAWGDVNLCNWKSCWPVRGMLSGKNAPLEQPQWEYWRCTKRPRHLYKSCVNVFDLGISTSHASTCSCPGR